MNILPPPEQVPYGIPQSLPDALIKKMLPDSIEIIPCETGICTTCDNNDHCIWQHENKINCEHFE